MVKTYKRKWKYMQKKRTFSAMEIALLAVLTGSLILSYIQARLDEGRRK